MSVQRPEKRGGIVLPLEEASAPGASRAKRDTSKNETLTNETFQNGTKEMGQYGTSPAVLFALAGLGLVFVLLFFGKLFGMPLGLPSALFLLLGILSFSLCFFLLVEWRTEKADMERKTGRGRGQTKKASSDTLCLLRRASLPFS